MAAPAAPQDLGKHGDRLYRYSTWVHVGPGAEECEGIDEDEGTNACGNPLHFHAWCRLPNPLQHREIRECGLAAKARRVRELRDPETDPYAVLEEELESLGRRGAKDSVIVELLQADAWKDHMEAVIDVTEIPAPDQPAAEEELKLYAHIEADQDRYVELGEKKQAADGGEIAEEEELKRLDDHIRAYNAAVDERRAEIEKPRREALDAKDISELLDMLRDQRIDVDSNAQFMHTYSLFQWLACTLRDPKSAVRIWSERSQLDQAAPEVIFAVQDTFQDLDRTRQEVMQGNS